MKAQVDEVAGIMRQNIDKTLARGEKVEELSARSQMLNESAGQFDRSATKLKREMRCRNRKVRPNCRCSGDCRVCVTTTLRPLWPPRHLEVRCRPTAPPPVQPLLQAVVTRL